ncbi:MAG TPA: PA2169 family four-helix-bundle protein [Acidobacteriaceae bacterium]|nr:PA2169 family four-helix-bundle protein [Acidobacteriaceae bacterium]
MSNNENTIKVVRSVIQVLRDGQQGMATIGSELKDEAAKHFCLEETHVRANYAAELTNELHRLGVPDVNETGTASGTVHRVWAELKSKLGGGDHTLLETAEQGEDEAKRKYAEALQESLPGTVIDLLRHQQVHINQSHDIIRGFRDSKAS